MSSLDLPPLGALRAFEATARRRSFKDAATELFVTPTAISHQIRQLEEFLGVRVLNRTPQAVSLTPEGQVLFEAAGETFEALRVATRRVRTLADDQVLTLSSTPAFLSNWFIPRLAEARKCFPDLELKLCASDEITDLRAGIVDIAVRYGRGPFPPHSSTLLRNDSFAPVCSPRLGISSLEDLRSATLIHVDGRRVPQPTPDWANWSRAAGFDGLDVAAGPRFTDGNHALQAAIAGHGVTIVSLVLAEDAINAGLLVQPFSHTLSGEAFHFVVAHGIAGRADIMALGEWFLTQMRTGTNYPT
jgi:LysR family glycine cleavage system transcriptional activator